MSTDTTTLIEQARDPRLRTLLSYHAADPGNAQLALDIADQALAVGEPAIVTSLFHGSLDGLGDAQLDRLGHAHLELEQAEDATRAFETLMARGVDHPTVIANLAFAHLQMGATAEALSLLSDDVVSSDARAARIKVAALHDSGQLDEARAIAGQAMEDHPGDVPLHAAIAVLAVDLDDRALALRAAQQAGDHPDAITTLRTLALEKQDFAEATALFDRVLAQHDEAPRALLGRGLARMLAQDARGAAADLDHAARLFDDHSGSWTGAGWAHLMAGDLEAARQRFERALASALGDEPDAAAALSVVDALEGRVSEAKARIAALRQGGQEDDALAAAEALIDAAVGDPAAARALLERTASGALPSLAHRVLH